MQIKHKLKKMLIDKILTGDTEEDCSSHEHGSEDGSHSHHHHHHHEKKGCVHTVIYERNKRHLD